MARRRHRRRARRAPSLLPLAVLAGAVAVGLVLPAAELDEPAPATIRPAAPAPTSASVAPSAPAPRYRVVPRGPCPPGEQSFTVVDTAERTEWLCVRVTPP